MRKQRRLAFNREKPESKKTLFFSAIGFAAALSACAAATTAPARYSSQKPEIHRPVVSEPLRTEEETCGAEVEPALEEGEKVEGKICKSGRLFTLTDNALYIGNKAAPGISLDGIEVESHSTRTEMAEILKSGLVDWTASYDTAYFLTKDGMLTIVPAGDLEKGYATYKVSGKYEKIEHHNDLLFIAGQDSIRMMSFGPDMESAEIQFASGIENADFFHLHGRLFFGNEREKVEIVTESQGLSGVRIR
jgi:hypothetical protein